MRYSQNDEEDVILQCFKDRSPARFLDVGAHDGLRLSNTRALADRGWTGVLVEPSPAAFSALMDVYREQPGNALVHLAVVPKGKAGILEFSDSRGDFVSTFDPAHRGMWEGRKGHIDGGGVQFQPIHVAAVDFEGLVVAFPGPYAFVNLDVEGINFELFNELPLRKLRVEMICVEYQDRLDAIERCAMGQGYKRAHLTNENVLLVAE